MFVREIPLKETIEVQTTTQIVYPNLKRNSMLKAPIAGSIWYGYSFGERCVMVFLDEMLVKKLPAISEADLPVSSWMESFNRSNDGTPQEQRILRTVAVRTDAMRITIVSIS